MDYRSEAGQMEAVAQSDQPMERHYNDRIRYKTHQLTERRSDYSKKEDQIHAAMALWAATDQQLRTTGPGSQYQTWQVLDVEVLEKQGQKCRSEPGQDHFEQMKHLIASESPRMPY